MQRCLLVLFPRPGLFLKETLLPKSPTGHRSSGQSDCEQYNIPDTPCSLQDGTGHSERSSRSIAGEISNRTDRLEASRQRNTPDHRTEHVLALGGMDACCSSAKNI